MFGSLVLTFQLKQKTMTEVNLAVSCCQTFLCAVRRVKSDGCRGQGSPYRVPCESCFRLRPPDLPTSVLCSLGSVGLRGPADQLDGHDKTEAAEDAHSYIEKQAANTHTHPGETQASYYSKRLPSLTLAFSSQAHFSPTSSAPPRAAVCSCVSPALWECVRMCVCFLLVCTLTNDLNKIILPSLFILAVRALTLRRCHSKYISQTTGQVNSLMP